MWGAFLKIFKPSTFRSGDSGEEKESNESEMSDTTETETSFADVPEIRSLDEYEGFKAKQRSSILWLTAKANNNKIPDDLQETHYKDHDDQDQLKPVLIHALASAEYYCLALGTIYADPNYHHLNHWGVIQALARKGVYVAEPSDVALTETVLIQTSPIRMSAHMAVIEAIMTLYIRETVTTERIVHAVRRFTTFSPSNELPSDTEEALVLWVNKSCVKMKHRIEEQMNANNPEIQTGGDYLEHVPPSISVLQDLSDLSDGCCLATLISFYCPLALKWQDICYNNPMSMADSLYNLQLVQRFCRDHLPFNPCFLTLEDLVYQHSSVRQNILAFLADLFFLLEIKPVKCVQMPGLKPEGDHAEAHALQNGRGFLPVVSPAGKRSFQQPVSPIPDLRSNSYSSMPDINRISPRSQTSPQQPVKEPMFPRRQVMTQQGESRTFERPKRYSFHEASRGAYGHATVHRSGSAEETGGSIRRTHSLLEIKSATEKGYSDGRVKGRESTRKSPNGESRYHDDPDSEPEIYYVHHSRGFTPPSSCKVPDDGSRLPSGYDELDEAFSRSLRKHDEERLLPARLRPSKERNNLDSKTEERGEHDRRAGHPAAHPTVFRPRVSFPRRSSIDEREARTRRLSGADSIPVDQFNSGQLSFHDNVPKHSAKNDTPQGQVGESFIFPEKYSLETAKAAGIPIVHDEDLINFDRFQDNKELEERLAAQNYGKTTLFVPGGDSNKTQYIIIAPNDNGNDESKLISTDKQPIHTTSFAQLSKLREHQGGGINIVYMQHDRDNNFEANRHPLKSSFLQKRSGNEKKTTTFATAPNTTTSWHQQGATSSVMSPGVDSGHETPSDSSTDPPLATQLHNVRLKLEEKRRRIEVEKRKMELMLNRARQKVGKAAFLQAVTKGKGSGRNTPDSGASGDLESPTTAADRPVNEATRTTPQDGAYTIQEIAENLNLVQNKWLESQMSVDTLSGTDSDRPSPDIDGVTFEEYTKSLERLNTNLSDIQSDIQRLSHQQDTIQQMVHNGMVCPPDAGQRSFYVGDVHTQQWTQPQHHLQQDQDFGMGRQPQVSPAQRRAQWGPSVGSDMHMTSMGSVMQQRGNVPMSVPYSYVDQHGYVVRQPHDGFSLHQQPSGGPPVSQNGPNPDQYAPYGQYGPISHGNQSAYHQPVPPASDIYTRYTPPQMTPAPAPFRLHIEGPPPVQPAHHTSPLSSRSQPQVVYQKPVQTSPATRPTSIHSSLPSKQFSVKAPPESLMEPQSVHFIDDEESGDGPERPNALSSLESVSGTATYRVRESTSPTRPLLSRTFRVPKGKVSSPSQERPQVAVAAADDDDDASDDTRPSSRKSAGSDTGFFVAFDDDQPKRSKPPLRVKKVPRYGEDGSLLYSPAGGEMDSVPTSYSPLRSSSVERTVSTPKEEQSPFKHAQVPNHDNIIKVNVEGATENEADEKQEDTTAVGFVIKETDSDPGEEEDMARKRERILLNAVKRKERQEQMRVQKELEAAQRREQERIKQEVHERKREDERFRRQAIFEQYKQRKAMEEQEMDRIDPVKTSTLPKTKTRQTKPRPKSLHESAMSAAETRSSNLNLASSGSRGSQLNLAGSDASGSASFRYGDTDSGLGRATPPRRAPSPGQATYRHPLSPSTGPPSLPPGLVARRGGPISDTASDTCSTTSSTLEYTGPKLFKQPTAKSNRGIVINAINSVLAGAVNQEAKKRALEEIAQSDSKHFLILFRDSGCQFRALYSYIPEKEDVTKLFGTGPKQVSEQMIDHYYKYNSGGKSFMEIQTKHLTVTIDAFTIHNILWQGKKAVMPKKDFF